MSAINAQLCSATWPQPEEASHMQKSTTRCRHIQVPQLPFTYVWSLGRKSADTIRYHTTLYYTTLYYTLFYYTGARLRSRPGPLHYTGAGRGWGTKMSSVLGFGAKEERVCTPTSDPALSTCNGEAFCGDRLGFRIDAGPRVLKLQALGACLP